MSVIERAEVKGLRSESSSHPDLAAGDRNPLLSPPTRISLDPENVERGLAKLVLALLELIRRLLERQAVRRLEAGSLTEDQLEKLGQTFSRLEQKLIELRELFGLSEEDLQISLGPLGRLY